MNRPPAGLWVLCSRCDGWGVEPVIRLGDSADETVLVDCPVCCEGEQWLCPDGVLQLFPGGRVVGHRAPMTAEEAAAAHLALDPY